MKTKKIICFFNILFFTSVLIISNSCKLEKSVKENTEEVRKKVYDWNRLNNSYSQEGLDSLLNDNLNFNGKQIRKTDYIKGKENWDCKFHDSSGYEIFDTIHIEQDGTPNGVVYRCYLIRKDKRRSDDITTFTPMVLDFMRNEEDNWKLVSENKISSIKNKLFHEQDVYIQNNFTNENKDLIDISISGRVYLYKYKENYNNTIYELGLGGTFKKYITWNDGIGSIIEKNDNYPFDGLGELTNAQFSPDDIVYLECKAWENSNAIFYAYDDRIYFVAKGSLFNVLSNTLIRIKTNEIGEDNKRHDYIKVTDHKGNVLFSELCSEIFGW